MMCHKRLNFHPQISLNFPDDSTCMMHAPQAVKVLLTRPCHRLSDMNCFKKSKKYWFECQWQWWMDYIYVWLRIWSTRCCNYFQIFQELKEIDLNDKDKGGWTLFMKKIDLNTIDNGGWTLFLKYIDLNYIYLNALDNGGWTTFMLANGYGQQDVVKCLPDHLSGTIRKFIWMSKTMAEMNSILRQIFSMVVCDDEWNWPSFLALPINSVLFEECTRNGLIKCAMMLLWLLPARVSLLTFAGSTRRWCYEM